MIKEAKSADQKLLMVRAVDHRAVSSSIAALITTMKRPRESNTAGRVSNFRKEPIVMLISEKRSATQK